MLKNTFCHIPGVGLKTEKNLWRRGVLSWDSAIDIKRLPERARPLFVRSIEESRERLEARDLAYFSALLPPDQQWRLFSEFRKGVAYLDIETNGYAGPTGYITAISLYDGRSVRYYVRGENLHAFKHDIRDYSVVVTYNGKCFDIPFIESHMNIRIRQPHIDLRYILKDLGFTGGLKSCEKKLGIDRGELDGVDGYFAVLLWNDYRRNNNPRALETLLAYNIQDVVNLEPLMVTSYNLKLAGTPFEKTHRLPDPMAPEKLPFKPDTTTIERLFSEHSRHYQTV